MGEKRRNKILSFGKSSQGVEDAVVKCIREDIDFKLTTKNAIISFMGGILSKLQDGKLYIYNQGKGWLEA